MSRIPKSLNPSLIVTLLTRLPCSLLMCFSFSALADEEVSANTNSLGIFTLASVQLSCVANGHTWGYVSENQPFQCIGSGITPSREGALGRAITSVAEYSNSDCGDPSVNSDTGWSTGSIAVPAHLNEYTTSLNGYDTEQGKKEVRLVSIQVNAGSECDDSWTFYFGMHAYTENPDAPIGPEDLGGCSTADQKGLGDSNLVGFPCNVGNGNKFLSHTDYSDSELSFTRYYNSLSAADTEFSKGWNSNATHRLKIEAKSTVDGTPYTEIGVFQGNRGETFHCDDSNSCSSQNFNRSELTIELENDVVTAYQYVTPAKARYRFNADGLLINKTALNGREQSYAYVGGKLATITGHFGRSLEFGHDMLGRLSWLEIPDGQKIHYLYDANGNLSSVVKPGGTTVYHYENADYPNHLMGITDESNTRIRTFGYRPNGRAETTQMAGDTAQHVLSFLANETTLTLPNQATEKWVFQEIKGRDYWVEKHSDEDGGVAYRTLNEWGKPLSLTDWRGNTTEYEYNAQGLLGRKIEASGTASELITDYEWDTRFPKKTKQTLGNLEIRWVYDEFGNLLSETHKDLDTAEERSTHYSYGVNGLLEYIDGPRTDVSDITHYYYDAFGRLIETVNALGHSNKITDYDDNNKPLTLIDENNRQTDLTYYTNGLLHTQSSQGIVTTYYYTASGLISKVEHDDGTEINYSYDDSQRLDAMWDGQGNRLEYVLNDSGQVEEETYKDPEGLVTYYHKRVFNNLNELAEVFDADNNKTTFVYDLNGNLEKTIDGRGYETVHIYNPLNELKQTLDAAEGITQFEYDKSQLTLLEDANQRSHIMEYNAFGDLVREISPDKGTSEFAYDSAGNQILRTDSRGISVEYQYDALGRLTNLTVPSDSSENISISYDQPVENRFNIGLMTGIAYQGEQEQFSYNQFAGLSEHDYTISSIAYLKSFDYDQHGRLVAIHYPNGSTVSWTYGNTGKIDAIKKVVDGVEYPLATNITYQPFGPLDGMQYGNAVNVSKVFDTNYRLKEILDSYRQQVFNYDASGNVSLVQDSLNSGDKSFDYDGLNRLASSSVDSKNFAYLYDAIGNRSLKQQDSSVLKSVLDVDGKLTATETIKTEADVDWSFASFDNVASDTPYHVGYIKGGVSTVSATDTPWGTQDVLEFNGNSGTVISYGNSEELKLTSGSFEAWIKKTDSRSRGTIFGKQNAYGLYVYYNKIAIWHYTTGGYWESAGPNLYDGNWHHIAMTYEAGVSDGIKLYVDGELVLSTTDGVSNQNSALVTGAYYQSGSAGNFKGQILYAAAYDEVLSSAEIAARYQSSELPLDDSRLLTFLNSDAVISRPYSEPQQSSAITADFKGKFSTIHNASSNVDFNKKYFHFTGESGAVIDLGNSNELDLSVGTLSAWIKTDNAYDWKAVIAKDRAYGLWLYRDKIATYNWDTATAHYAGPVISDGQWHHVAVTFQENVEDGSVLYVDGQEVYRAKVGFTGYTDNTVIGNLLDDGTLEMFDGDIASPKIYSEVLSPLEIAAIYHSRDAYDRGEENIVVNIDYDDAGNTTTIGSQALSYDAQHRLTSISNNGELVQYRYNSQHQRIAKITATDETHYHYDLSGKLISETDAAGQVLREYVYLNGEPLAQLLDGEIYYYHNDHLATPQLMSDANQNVVWQAEYDPFGNASILVADVENNLRFPGQYFDSESGLYYNWHRYYDPSTGRYLTSDPLGLIDGPNTYAYVKNNPINFIDPLGLASSCGANPVQCAAAGMGPSTGAGSGGGKAAAAAATAAAAAAHQKECDDEKAKRCEEQLDRDNATCDAILRAEVAGRRPKGAAKRCYSSAMERFGNCLADRDRGPLDTWNN